MVIQKLLQLFSNSIFQAGFYSYVISQIIKFIINVLMYKFAKEERRASLKAQQFDKTLPAKILLRNGGMPSSHSCSASAVTMSIAFNEGVDSSSFLVALFFTCVLVSDAIGVRRQVGLLSEKFNQFIKLYYTNHKRELPDNKELTYSIDVVHGHTTSEVSVGVMLGMVIAWLLYLYG